MKLPLSSLCDGRCEAKPCKSQYEVIIRKWVYVAWSLKLWWRLGVWKFRRGSSVRETRLFEVDCCWIWLGVLRFASLCFGTALLLRWKLVSMRYEEKKISMLFPAGRWCWGRMCPCPSIIRDGNFANYLQCRETFDLPDQNVDRERMVKISVKKKKSN